MNKAKCLYRAPVVLPVAGPPLLNGAVLTENGRVLAVGPYAELRSEAVGLNPADELDYDGHVLVPALVNAHCHLELSHLATLSRDLQSEPGDLPGWIRRLLAAREKYREVAPGIPGIPSTPGTPDILVASGASDVFNAPDVETGADPTEAAYAAILALARLHAGGCRTVIDIGNFSASRNLGRNFKTEVFFHLELLGFNGKIEQEALTRLVDLDPDLCCTAHAPYSTGARLMQALKKRAWTAQHLFPIHLAESAAEVEFLATGAGPFRDFLSERGLDLVDFSPPGLTPVAWLDALGLLDEKTLCVHAIQVSADDIARLAVRRCGVCLCPGANRHLGLGKAPLMAYLQHGIMPALGTDSLVGNDAFSLWYEMQLLRQDHPQVAPATVLAMASLAGARLLNRAGEKAGVIAPGASSALLAVACRDAVRGVEAALEYLTTAGPDIRLEWTE
ncbi:MAG: amidohydrolase [Desulfobulbaceae bacterium]|nr:MAG: amidohydrolase [Desulfobulbaceae bacterium]